MKTLITNGKIVGRKILANNILIENDKIADIDYKGEITEDVDVYDANGAYVMPGFIDVHVHGGGKSDFMDATKEDFETVVKTHLKYGTTLLTPTAMTATEENLKNFILAYKDFKENSSFSNFTAGIHLEGPYFSGANSKSKGAQSGDLLRKIDIEEMQRLWNLYPNAIVRWDAAPELENYDKFAEFCQMYNIIPSVAHTAATTEETLRAFEKGFSHITHFYNATTTYHKEGQKVLDGVVEATYLTDDVTVELICDGKHIPKGVLQLALKLKGVEKTLAITDGTALSGTDLLKGKLGGRKNGTDIIVDDGVAKLIDLSSYAGSICTMQKALKVLVQQYDIPLTEASIMLSLAPAKLLKIDKMYGSIEIGKKADLFVVDTLLNINCVMKDGKFIGDI